MLSLYFSLIFFFSLVSGDNQIVYRFCANDLRSSNGIACQAIQKGNSLVVCVPVIDSADCALKIQRKEADFGIFTAEETLLASKFVNDDVRIIGQLRNQKWDNESFAFQTVVVVRENFNGGFPGLQSMSYCHPGFTDGHRWSDRVLKEFEKAIIPRVCNEEYPNVHQEMYSIAHFFKSACRPGEWAMDDLVDKKLKKRFQTLCALCDLPGRCSYDDESQVSNIAALNCLTKNGGDVTYVSLHRVKEYFGLIPGFSENAKADEFKFLCPNGLTQPLSQPCPWVKQPWPVVVSAKDKAPLLTSLLPSFICHGGSGCRGTWKEAFTLLLEDTSNKFLPNIYGDRTLMDNIREARNLPREWEGDGCRRSVRWCTTNADEYEKCEWLRQAVISQDFEPRLSCVASNSMWSCFDLIRKKQADIIGIESDYAFTAENVFNLTTVMFQDNVYEGNYLIVAIVRADRQDINSLKDLKDKKACFPEYNGLAWNSFIHNAKSKKILPYLCPRIKAVANFFKDICAPGATDSNHKDYSNITIPAISNICSLCAKKSTNTIDNCEATSNNKYYGDFGAFSCLTGNSSNTVADVAFVNYRRLLSKENEEVWKSIKKTDYRILCANGTLIPLPEANNTVQFDETCALASGVRAQIVSRKFNAKHETRDIADLLLKMDDKFGEVITRYDNLIQMYRPFKGKPGLLLKETTVDFVTTTDQNNYQINSFNELKASVSEECHENEPKPKSNSNINKFSLSILLVTLITIFANTARRY